MADVKRLAHDALHIMLIPFSIAIVLGAVNPAMRNLVEKADLFVHLGFLALTVHSLRDWLNAKVNNRRIEVTPCDGRQWLAYAWDGDRMLAPAELPQLIQADTMDEAVREAKRRLRKWAGWRLMPKAVKVVG